MNHVVVLGGGTAGTLIANRLHRSLSDAEITVVDQDDRHVYQPGLLFLPFGLTTAEEIVRPRHQQFHAGIHYTQSDIDHVDIAADRVQLRSGQWLGYDILIIATGAVLKPDETEGLKEAAARGLAPSFYTLEGASQLNRALRTWSGGRLVIGCVDVPVKCPVAPLEFAFLADWFFSQRGQRAAVDITYSTPLDAAFTQPVAAETLGHLLADKGISVVTNFSIASVDADRRILGAYDGSELPFELAVVIPAHSGADYVGRSEGLGDALNFVPADVRSLQSLAAPNIFVMGDAAALPVSKAGSVAHFEGEVVATNVGRVLAGQPPDAAFDGHVNCFVETGYHRALLLDFNYATEPLPGHFPTQVGLPLLRESHLNHWGKLMFQWVYWHGLLPGHDIPGITPSMPARGKHQPHEAA